MTERDPIVAVALARRPVPDHAPGFWQELEARLAATPTDAEPDEATDATVIPLTDAPSRRRRCWLVLAAGVVSVAAVATVAFALVGDDDEDRIDEVVTDPTTAVTTAPAPPTSLAPTPTTTPAPPPSVVPGQNEAFQGVWPFTSDAEVDAYVASGSTEYSDPTVVVERFASEVIGVVNPVVSQLIPAADGTRAGTVEVRTRTEAGEVNLNLPPTVVAVIAANAAASETAPWLVTGATSEDVTIDSPAESALVGSPLTVSGQGSGYEGTVVVVLYSGTTEIAGPVPLIAGNPDLGPYSVVLSFTAPPAGQTLMLVARTDSGAEFVGVPAFAVTRLVASSGAASVAPELAVSGFLTAVASGGTDEAWAMVDPAAQAAGGGRTAFDAFTSDYAQDLAKLALQPSADFAVRRWSATSENEPDVSVVTVTDQAVTDNVTAMAFAVAADGKIVSTFPVERDPSVDAVGWVGNTTPAGQPLEILVPTSAVAPTISIDADGTPIEPSSVQPFPGEPQSIATFPMPNAPGVHVLTLAFLRPDGLVHVEAQLMTFTGAGPAAATPEQAVQQFLDAASRGDSAAAWALLDPAAQAENGDGIAFELSLEADDYGWSAFAALPDDAYSARAWAPGSPGTQPDTVVVTVAGDVTRNGATEFDVVAFPVMRSADGYRLVWTPNDSVESLPSRGAWPDGAIGGAPNGGLYFGGMTLPDSVSDAAISEPGGEPTGPIDVSSAFTFFEVPAEPSGQRVFTLSFLDTTGLVHAEAEIYNV